MPKIIVLINLSLFVLIVSGCRDSFYECENENDCYICSSNYVLNSEKQCISCNEGCRFCKYNEQFDNTTFIACYSGLQLIDNKRNKRIEYCSYHIINESSHIKMNHYV